MLALRLPPEIEAWLAEIRSVGPALKGARLGEFWKYRIGDYCLIVRIEDAETLILVLRVAHRREVCQ